MTTVIITICALLLIAYIFDLTSAKSKIPSVILLLLLGWGVKKTTQFLNLDLPPFEQFLPVLGTIGLILIVLEGSLELELNKSKKGVITKSFVGALVSMVITAYILTYLFKEFGGYSLKNSLINAIPFCIISSAIAIPTVINLSKENREFVIYESSLSDILGVLFFNFVALNLVFNIYTFGNFGLQLLVIILISLIATLGLAFLLSKIEHHIKFIPIILLVILIYTVLKEYHLPSLIFIMVFGLFIGNLNEMKQFKWINKFKPEDLNEEVQKFKEITIEAAFLVRTLFFLLFGFLLEMTEILNQQTLVWALGIVGIIAVVRIIQLKISGLPMLPLLFIAPRGLITVLLFISIFPHQNIDLVNKSLIVQVVILTTLVTMIALIMKKKQPEPSVLAPGSKIEDLNKKEVSDN
ncbi:MAG: sodium:proton antiporter [Bacteroidia bacterium]